MLFKLRTGAIAGFAIGVAALAAAAATLTAFPAAAAGVITAVTTVSCSVTGANWCISGNNTSSGIGVIGTSKTGTGLRGYEHLAIWFESHFGQRRRDLGPDERAGRRLRDRRVQWCVRHDRERPRSRC